MPKDHLKPIQGRLKAAPWSDIPITDELKSRLKNDADPGCRCCKGLGYLPGTVPWCLTVCLCVNRTNVRPS